MRPRLVVQMVTGVMLAFLASCGGGGTARIETRFTFSTTPYATPVQAGMRQALESKGVVIYAMLCGLENGGPGPFTSDGPVRFVEATIDKADLARALSAGPFSEVTAQTESARGLQAACGT